MDDLPFDSDKLEPDPEAEAEADRRHALIEAGLLIARPELQDRLIPEVPEGVEPLDYINEYSIDHWVRCAFCRQKQLHQHGYTALLPGDDRALCGSCCGERIFKHTHGRLRCRSKARQKRAIQDWAIGRLKTGIGPVRNLIEAWEPVAADLASVVGPLQSDLVSYSIPLRLNDAGRIDVIDGSEVIATIVGARVFGAKNDFREAGKLIQQAARLVFGPKLSTSDHKLLSEVLDELRDRIRSGCAFVRAGRQFLTEQNIGAVHQLSRLYGGPPVVWWPARVPTIRVDISRKNSNYYPVPEIGEVPDVEELLRGLRFS